MSFIVSSRSLQHRGGSKEYHLLAIENKDTSSAIIVMRWGKTNAWGQMKVEKGTRNEIVNLFIAKTGEKEKGGYEQTKNKTAEVTTAAEVQKLIGPQYYRNIGADNLAFLDPSFDTTAVKDPKAVAWEQTADGKWKPDNSPVKSKPEPPKEETFEERQARDPLWGMFG